MKIHGHEGTNTACKIILRCRQCPNAAKHSGRMFGPKEDINYHPTRYGNENQGYLIYDSHFEVNYTEASESAFLENDFLRHFVEEFHHGCLSYQAKSEAYNQGNMNSYRENRLKDFIRYNPEVGRRFQRKEREAEKDDGVDDDEMEESSDAGETTLMHELTRKTLSQAMLNYEVKQELLESGTIREVLFGPKKEGESRHVSFKESRRIYFEAVDVKRKETLYPHKCYDGCKKRGCQDISTFDGLWKIHHALCMWDCSTAYPKAVLA